MVSSRKLEAELPASVDDERWKEAPVVTLHLVPNVIKEDRLFTPLNDAVTVRTLYNDKEIAFLLEVDDRTKSIPGDKYFSELQDENLEMHPDAFAIQFPHEDAYMSAPMVKKPLYRHGDAKNKTTIWYWNAGSIEPRRDPVAMLFDGSGPDRQLEPREKDSSLSADGAWKEGRWKVLMKRPRFTSDGDVLFEEGQFIPVSFANWDGSNGESGSKHTLTTWYWLILPPEMDAFRVYGIPAGIAFLVFLAGLLLVRFQRKRQTKV